MLESPLSHNCYTWKKKLDWNNFRTVLDLNPRGVVVRIILHFAMEIYIIGSLGCYTYWKLLQIIYTYIGGDPLIISLRVVIKRNPTENS